MRYELTYGVHLERPHSGRPSPMANDAYYITMISWAEFGEGEKYSRTKCSNVFLGKNFHFNAENFWLPFLVIDRILSVFCLSLGPYRLSKILYTPCLRKTCAKLFLSELCQIFINFNNFWQIDEKMAKIIFYVNIFHLTSLMSSQYLVKHKSAKFLPNA